MMPDRDNKLTWRTITIASKIMLPTYVFTFGYLGVNYILFDASTLSRTPGLAYANDHFLTVAAWGCVFLTTMALMGLAFLRKSRMLFRYALLVCGVSMSLWALAMGAAFVFGDAAPTAWVWPWFIAMACYASNRSLLKGEM